MGSLVFDKRIFPRKTFPALGTRKRFLARVDPEMSPQVAPLHERLTALCAHKGSFPRGVSQVTDQVTFAYERFPALRTGIGAHACVLTYVSSKVGFTDEDR